MTGSAELLSPLFKLQPNATIETILSLNQNFQGTTKKEIFELNNKGQSPHALWIGCSDSRVSERAIDGIHPGEVFTMRNIANVVNNPDDLSSQTVIGYAVNNLKVKKILIVGHTDCGGVNGALSTEDPNDHSKNSKLSSGLIKWLAPIINLKFKYQSHLETLPSSKDKIAKLAEVNVQHQVMHLVYANNDVREAIYHKQLEVYGLLYNVTSGSLKLVDSLL